MEEWEFELEFLTYDTYEKAIDRQGSTEEYEVEQEDFNKQIEEFNNQFDVKTDEDEWEEIK